MLFLKFRIFSFFPLSFHHLEVLLLSIVMAQHTEDLIDYEDEEELNTVAHVDTAAAAVAAKKEETKKGSYVGIHATGFRDFLLKPELLRAIVDCGFEHPSEGDFF